MWEEEGGTDELSVRAWITCVKSQYVRACVCVWFRVSVCVCLCTEGIANHWFPSLQTVARREMSVLPRAGSVRPMYNQFID